MLTTIIPSYLYTQYNDDDDLQAFVMAFNQLAQDRLDWFSSLNLPIYTADNIAGLLLDWVAQGIYGLTRPVLSSGISISVGQYNTFAFNTEPFGYYKLSGPSDYYITNDDIFKRIITWNFYKGDGMRFNVQWLKRRIMRFLTGKNGTAPNIDDTHQISVTFGTSNDVTITLMNGIRTINGGTLYNSTAFNTLPFNDIESTFASEDALPNIAVFQAAVQSGVLNLPFQYSFTVNIMG
ncbi:hypothetical protein [Martelella alba]|uniref:Uncharacterized protein n=1 Tax=Martelella alba TaxID=2590451 RepID=A0ABY2SS60_9HYPH|nr:hypothetical protein [Martelella alba]TKI08335.1 hypothetical protein FCN80_04110 [Martelella alba]